MKEWNEKDEMSSRWDLFYKALWTWGRWGAAPGILQTLLYNKSGCIETGPAFLKKDLCHTTCRCSDLYESLCLSVEAEEFKEAFQYASLLDSKAVSHTSKPRFLPGGKSLRHRIKRQFCHPPASWPWTRKPLNLSLLQPFHWGNRKISTWCKLAWML